MTEQIFVAGLQKQSFIDYPGKISCVIFLAGCNMRCHYCHNSSLFDVRENKILLEEVLSYISSNRKMLDAVVVSGGEPTQDKNLLTIIKKVKELGLLVKLDTNGTNPNIVTDLINNKLIDYIALDIKSPQAKHKVITGIEMDKVLETAEFLKHQNVVDYMFRTTVTPKLNENDITEMGEKVINNAKVWQLQQCRIDGAHKPDIINKFAEIAKKYALNIVVRGL